MSFKRADDNSQSLHELRRRRVGDLLREDIGDDEVLRLSNGRLTCMVCHHRPIFDTLDMFYIHRQGKKHTQNAAYKAIEKQELQDLIMKRKHEQFVKTGNTNIIQAPHSSSTFLGQRKPYDPRTKKKPSERKPTLDIGASSSDVEPSVGCCSLEQLPGNSKDLPNFTRKTQINQTTVTSDTCSCFTKTNKMTANPMKHTCKQFDKGKAPMKRFQINEGDSTVIQAKEIGKFISKVGQDQDPSHYIARRKRLKAETTKLEIGHSKQNTVSNGGPSESKSTVDWEKFQKYKAAIIGGSKKPVTFKLKNSVVNHTDKQAITSHSEPDKTDKPKCDNSVSGILNPANQALDKRAQAERELQLRGAGWKRDWTGKWVRDEEAEFDSDEETPDLP